MTWTKVSDDFTDECWTLSDEAFRLHIEGLTWSNRKRDELVWGSRRTANYPPIDRLYCDARCSVARAFRIRRYLRNIQTEPSAGTSASNINSGWSLNAAPRMNKTTAPANANCDRRC